MCTLKDIGVEEEVRYMAEVHTEEVHTEAVPGEEEVAVVYMQKMLFSQCSLC
jgi:hypothetical protein